MERKVIALVSGGLDSLLATRVMQEQGIEVTPVHLVSPWGCDEKAIDALERQIGTQIVRIDKGAEYLGLVRNPKFGYGKNMNPCVDCRVFMFRRIRPMLEEIDAAAIVTGEVVGQRPMSQVRRQMDRIDAESGMRGLILRPLCAKRLPPTMAEEAGIVDREKLYGFSGRTRGPQMALAREFGITEFASPGGGCKLTTAGFTPKMVDFFEHYEDADLTDAKLLNYGRHFRVSDDVKVILGRDKEENAILESLAANPDDGAQYTAYASESFSGPTALVCGSVSNEVERLVGRAIMRYSRRDEDPPEGFRLRVVTAGSQRYVVVPEEPMDDLELARYRIGQAELPVVG